MKEKMNKLRGGEKLCFGCGCVTMSASGLCEACEYESSNYPNTCTKFKETVLQVVYLTLGVVGLVICDYKANN